MRASPDEALTESTNDVAPAMVDLQSVLLITLYNHFIIIRYYYLGICVIFLDMFIPLSIVCLVWSS